MKQQGKTKTMLVHILWLGAAVLLFAAGAGSLLVGKDADAPALWAGAMILLSGLMQMGLTRLMRRNAFGDKAFLSKGLHAVAVGALILCRWLIAADVLRALVSMMVLMAGVNMLSGAMSMRADRIRGRWALAGIGAVEMLLGAAGFLRPELLGALAAPITGVSLMYEGLAVAFTWHMGMKWVKGTQAAA